MATPKSPLDASLEQRRDREFKAHVRALVRDIKKYGHYRSLQDQTLYEDDADAGACCLLFGAEHSFAYDSDGVRRLYDALIADGVKLPPFRNDKCDRVLIHFNDETPTRELLVRLRRIGKA